MSRQTTEDFTRSYDICLSFAGEDRVYVEALAKLLQNAGVRTFYDEFEKADLWGKDLYSHLHDIYQNQARYCVMFISKHYVEKAWTALERRSAQARAFESNTEYLLPVRFDDTEVPGLPSTIAFVDTNSINLQQLCEMIIRKVGPRPRTNYFPPVPDRLFKRLKARSKQDKKLVLSVCYRFFESLSRTTAEERLLVYDIFMHACPAELPDNVHIDLDLLRRITGLPVTKIRKLSSGMQSLGFYQTIRKSHNPDDVDDNSGPVLVLEWHNMSTMYNGIFTWMVNDLIDCVTDYYCPEHARDMFERLDFGQLSTSTTVADQH
jgi:hypothetical protein